jgi:hypothetical protein
MLTTAELAEAREKLRQAHALIESVRLSYLSSSYLDGARLLNDALHLLDDEVCALNRCVTQQRGARL